MQPTGCKVSDLNYNVRVMVPHKVVLSGMELAEVALLGRLDGLVGFIICHQQQLILGEEEVSPAHNRSEARHLLPPFDRCVLGSRRRR